MFPEKKIRTKNTFNEFQLIANKSQKSLIDEKLLEMWPKLKKIKEKEENANDSENVTKSETIIGQFKPVRVSKFYKVQKGYKHNNSIELLKGNGSYS